MNFVNRRLAAICWIKPAVLLSCFLPLMVFAQSDKPDCQCRAADGGMRNLGTVECVNIAGREKLVLCTMSTNTPYWKDVAGGESCPDA